MRTEVIKADTIDAAVERILIELGADTRRSNNRENAIYFDGWNGLGASAVLQDVAKRLAVSGELSPRPVGLEFQNIIHIDCSKWESRRAMQKKIAEQLKLTDSVMEMFDKQDEEDDFNGLDQGSRGEIAQVSTKIYQTMQNRRFLAILHNGGNEEIDIFNSGLSLYEYANSKMLWTFRGRFRLDPKVIDSVKSTTTHVLLSASRDVRDLQELRSCLVRHEAAQISWNKHGHAIIDSASAAECVLYILKHSWLGSHIIDYNWDIHASNYWICDGIITLTDIDQAWQVGNALQHEVQLLLNTDSWLNNDESRLMTFRSQLASSAELMPYWISTTTCGFVLNPSGVILDNMFQHSHMLGVLKISRCAFTFSSPPFLCCHSLRFLCIENCQDLRTRTSTTDHCQLDAGKHEELSNSPTMSWECFQSLWVLDVRYTDWDQILSACVMDLMLQLRELNVIGAKNWDMSHLRLRKLRKLRITKSTCYFNNDVFSEMGNIELLDFSGNTIRQGMTNLSGAASNSSLNSVIIDGCDGLKIISFRDCKALKNLLLKGSVGSLEELDLSGTNVKTLNLGGVHSTLPNRIILLGCERLHAILWPESGRERGWNGMLQINTTSASAAHACLYGDRSLQMQKEEWLKDGWQIFVTDARLLRSLPLKPCHLSLADYFMHIDFSSLAILGESTVEGTSSELVQVKPHRSTVMDSEYRDVLKDDPVEVMMMWGCPEIPIFQRWGSFGLATIKVIMHVHANKLLEDAPSALLIPSFICEWATSLHVYCNSSITSIPAPSRGEKWGKLMWCRVERCPKIHTVFTVPIERLGFLETFWASQLLSAHYILEKPIRCFRLRVLHLDHCPRLVHVLPLATWNTETFHSLETLQIVYCGDLKEVFPLGLELQERDEIIKFPDLKRIHLHELPMLQRIGGHRMWAPNLETIKIRGCWSLRRLPTVGGNTKLPKVDCEKEWWDNLEWDGLEENHHPSLYEPRHSLYYKAQLPRGSILR